MHNVTLVLINRQIFCDFGENFRIVDATGEQPISVLISHISRVSQASVRKGEFFMTTIVML